MRRLRDFQPVLLQAGATPRPCRVVAVQDEEAVLLPDDPGPVGGGAARERATLAFEHDGHRVLLHGIVDPGPLAGTTRFAVLDRLSGPEARRAPRMPLDVPALVKAAGAVLPAGARTVDVGRGGVQLSGFTAPEGTAVTVLLTLPGSDERLDLEGRIVRSGQDRCAVAFDRGAEDVAHFVLRCRGVLAERLAERAALRAAALSGR